MSEILFLAPLKRLSSVLWETSSELGLQSLIERFDNFRSVLTLIEDFGLYSTGTSKSLGQFLNEIDVRVFAVYVDTINVIQAIKISVGYSCVIEKENSKCSRVGCIDGADRGWQGAASELHCFHVEAVELLGDGDGWADARVVVDAEINSEVVDGKPVWGRPHAFHCIVRRFVDDSDVLESPVLSEDLGVRRLGGPVRGDVVVQAVEERGRVLANRLGHGPEGAVGVARGESGLGEPACVPGVGRMKLIFKAGVGRLWPIWKGEIRVGRFIYTLSCWPLLAAVGRCWPVIEGCSYEVHMCL